MTPKYDPRYIHLFAVSVGIYNGALSLTIIPYSAWLEKATEVYGVFAPNFQQQEIE